MFFFRQVIYHYRRRLLRLLNCFFPFCAFHLFSIDFFIQTDRQSDRRRSFPSGHLITVCTNTSTESRNCRNQQNEKVKLYISHLFCLQATIWCKNKRFNISNCSVTKKKSIKSLTNSRNELTAFAKFMFFFVVL
jgi:hypothetical protein